MNKSLIKILYRSAFLLFLAASAFILGWKISVRRMVSKIELPPKTELLESRGNVLGDGPKFTVSMKEVVRPNIGEQGIVVRDDRILAIIAIYEPNNLHGFAKVVRRIEPTLEVQYRDSIVWYVW